MKKYDISLHFTIKNQTVESVDKKFNEWLESDKYQGQFDFSERSYKMDGVQMEYDEPRSVLHHCFLPKKTLIEKNIPLTVWDFLETVSEHIVCWYGTTLDGDALVWDRRLMLENIKKTNGVAIFIGNMIEGVKEEYDIAVELGIDCIVIP
jgi:hypothetical protein